MKKLNCVITIFFLTITLSFAEGLKFGVASVVSAGNTVYLYEKLNEYISKKLDQKVELVSRKNYRDMEKCKTIYEET